MARPKDADSARTWDAIVDAASATLREQDGAFPSMRVIAQRAGLSLGTLQYYFEDKDALLEACLDGYHQRMATIVGEVFARAATETDGRAFIEDTLRAFVQAAYDNRWQLRLRAALNASRGELHPSRQAEFQGQLPELASQLLARHVQVDPSELRLAIHAIGVLITRVALASDTELARITGVRERPREAAIDWLVRAGRRMVRPLDG